MGGTVAATHYSLDGGPSIVYNSPFTIAIDGVQQLLALSELGRVTPFLAGMCGDTTIGSAALLHVAAAAGELPMGTAITPHFSKLDLVTEPLQVVDGQVQLDAVDTPCIGVTIDKHQVERLAIGD